MCLTNMLNAVLIFIPNSSNRLSAAALSSLSILMLVLVGIMNIMYVSVKERTREIGLRMAVGARGKDILLQFLTESIFISVTGGMIGVVFGIVATKVTAALTQWPTEITLSSIVISFFVCAITGIFFGWYPAKKAANLNPIEALRYE